MSKIPDVDNKPKYNQNKPYEWVDSQWEKFMTEQKELKAEILNLEMKNAEMRDRLIDMGEDVWLQQHDKWCELNTLVYATPNNMELGKQVRTMIWKEENGEDN